MLKLHDLHVACSQDPLWFQLMSPSSRASLLPSFIGRLSRIHNYLESKVGAPKGAGTIKSMYMEC